MAEHERLICAASEIAEQGKGVRFELIRYGQPQPAFVVRFDGQPRAFVNQCGHPAGGTRLAGRRILRRLAAILDLLHGVDDRFWTLFGSAFTVYGGCKVNLSALTNVQLIAALLSLSAKNQNDPVLQDPQKLFALAGIVAKAKLFGVQFSKTDEFITFVKDPAAMVGELAGQTSMAGSNAQQAMNAGLVLPGGQKLGLELDAAKLGQIAAVGPRRTYRVEAWGEIDRKSTAFPPIRSTITGVWDTKVQNQNARKDSSSTRKGTWVFLRED